jgi:hypothetical protein
MEVQQQYNNVATNHSYAETGSVRQLPLLIEGSGS